MLRQTIMTTFLTMTLFGCQMATSKDSDCKTEPVKYLSTFRSSRMWKVMGGDEKWELASVKELVDMANKDEKALFFIPVMLYQIKGYYERTDWSNDEKEFAQEVSNFLALTLDDDNLKITDTNNKAFCAGLKKLTNAFYSLCEDDKVFYHMIYTMDDGPFTGIDTDLTLPVKDSLSLVDINAKMYLRQLGDTCTIELVDSEGRIKWKKIIAQSTDYYIKDVEFANEPIRNKNELGYKIGLNGSGEFIHLYLRTDGAFRLYYHSW